MSAWRRANTDWMHNSKWGTFVHYLADYPSCQTATDSSSDDWNRRVDSFDVERYASRLANIGCPYTFLTIGQNSGYYCSPNRTYDDIVGRVPSRLSKRDLIGDLATACTKRGIRLCVYFTAAAPFNDMMAVQRLRCTPPWDCTKIGFPKNHLRVEDSCGTDERMSDFQRYWESIIREWSLRWGSQIHAWWIDGCYAADRMYRHDDAPNFRSFAEALKAGNPDSLIAFNPGVRNPIQSCSEYDDFTSGEISNTLPTNGAEPCVIPVGRMLNGAQYHLLTFLGGGWSHPVPRFTDEMVLAYTRYVNSWDGVISWDHPLAADGTFPPAFWRQLELLGKTMRQ